MCHGVNKIQKKLETGDRDRGTPKLLRNYGPGPWYSEITPKLGNRGIPKLLRNWGPWNSEITPKSFRNYSETTPKLGNRGIPK